jgi:hypothetical protein
MPRHLITIPGWRPATVNQLLRTVRGRIRYKKLDRALITAYGRLAAVPPATVRRRVSAHITLGPGQKAADPDAYWKSLLDALVQAGMLVDDDAEGVEFGPVTFGRGPSWGTAIALEDLDGEPAPGRL